MSNDVREMHWHKEAECACMLGGRGRITAVDAQGRSFIDDVGPGDLGAYRERTCVTLGLPTVVGRTGAAGELDPGVAALRDAAGRIWNERSSSAREGDL